MSTKREIIVVGHGMVGQRLVEKLTKYVEETEQDIHITVFGEEKHVAYDRVKLTSYFEHLDPAALHLQDAEWYEQHKKKVTLCSNERVVSVDPVLKTVATESGNTLPYDELVLATGSVPFVPPMEGITVDKVQEAFRLHVREHHGGSCDPDPETGAKPRSKSPLKMFSRSRSKSPENPAASKKPSTKGVFVYRTVDDLDDMITYVKERNVKTAAVLGGGLLGLEAMRVCSDKFNIDTVTVVDTSPWLMRRQLDQVGGTMLVDTIRGMGYGVLLNKRAEKVIAKDGYAVGIQFSDDPSDALDAELIIIAAGIRPRDDLARQISTVKVHPKGGIITDDRMATSDSSIYAVGECVLHQGIVYGLVAPCYEMAEVLAYNLTHGKTDKHVSEETLKEFEKGDMSTKLKLMGVDVASFGEYSIGKAGEELDDAESVTFKDQFAGIYRKLTFTNKGQNLIGGILVGDASDYSTLTMLAKSTKPLTMEPSSLLVPPSLAGGAGVSLGAEDMDDDAQVCSCNDVSKGDICSAVENGCESVDAVAKCTQAGTSCGGCKPVVKTLVDATLKKLGKAVNNSLCPHFAHTRAELFHIVQVFEFKTFDELYDSHGTKGTMYRGCEVCKPAVASILASLWNEFLMKPQINALQDTNDRFLGNIQRGGSYSVVPRVPGGELTPDKLIVLGQVAQKYKLYTKITGGQRVDLFGAEKQDLPAIWEELVDAGFESGHAYGKSLRTVKSCVGSTWCRYGMGDSVGFAITLEERYRGVRSPHKLKGGVSGCVRECAEAQSKDFGLIATAEGYNLYLCGNGGSVPRHATLFASGIDEETCIKYLDRFLMFYIRTADKLQRTARWLEGLEGGIEYLRKVIIEDSLGINAELEAQMANLINTYKCEWTEVVRDPERRQQFIQYANAPNEPRRNIEFINQRGQQRPADWPKDGATYLPHTPVPDNDAISAKSGANSYFKSGTKWVPMLALDKVPAESGVVLKYGNSELALFKIRVNSVESKSEEQGVMTKVGSNGVKMENGDQFQLYCTQNMCPHKNSFVLSSGILGDHNGSPKVACPIHKNRFLLTTGECIDKEEYKLWNFRCKVDVETKTVMIRLPVEAELDAILANDKYIVKAEYSAKENEAKISKPVVETKVGSMDW